MPPEIHGQWDPPVTLNVPAVRVFDPVDRRRHYDDTRGLFVIHAVLMHSGDVLWFCGHTEGMNYPAMAYVFDPTGRRPMLQRRMPEKTDLFCCHYVQLYDGRVLIVGGSEQDIVDGNNREYHGSEGAKAIVVFDPQTRNWSDTKGLKLRFGRWYPTAVMLGDGRTLVLSGRRESGAGSDSARSGTGPISGNPHAIADTVEVIAPRVDGCKTLQGTPLQLPIYPGAHPGPPVGGLPAVYTTHTTWGQEIDEPRGQVLTVTETHATWTALTQPAAQPTQRYREEGMSVMLPVTLPRPSSWGRILVVGGGLAVHAPTSGPERPTVITQGRLFTRQATDVDPKSAEILNTTSNPPSWTAAADAAHSLRHPRVNCHCVLLPDATVLVVGGHGTYKWNAKASRPGNSEAPTTPTLPAEIYTPGVGFKEVASLTHPRMYHSVALLLPNGRVLVAGGADPNEHEPRTTYPANWRGRTYGGGDEGVPRLNGDRTAALNRKDYEIYAPPYCFGGARPNLDRVSPAQVHYGATFTVTSPQAASIRHVAIMRPGAPTHHTDSEQRYVELAFDPPSGNDITVHMAPASESWLVVPGFYMVWIVDDAGRPCNNAGWVQVVHPAPWPPVTPKSRWPCVVATVSLGSDTAPEVRYLRALRTDIESSGPIGARFITTVNDVYYSFSPALASWLAHHDRARDAVRDVLVRPGTRAIRAASAAASRAARPRCTVALLITLLLLEAAFTILLAPVICLAIAAHVVLSKAERRDPVARQEATGSG